MHHLRQIRYMTGVRDQVLERRLLRARDPGSAEDPPNCERNLCSAHHPSYEVHSKDGPARANRGLGTLLA
jgi:hypothetical protein